MAGGLRRYATRLMHQPKLNWSQQAENRTAVCEVQAHCSATELYWHNTVGRFCFVPTRPRVPSTKEYKRNKIKGLRMICAEPRPTPYIVRSNCWLGLKFARANRSLPQKTQEPSTKEVTLHTSHFCYGGLWTFNPEPYAFAF